MGGKFFFGWGGRLAAIHRELCLDGRMDGLDVSLKCQKARTYASRYFFLSSVVASTRCQAKSAHYSGIMFRTFSSQIVSAQMQIMPRISLALVLVDARVKGMTMLLTR